MTRDEYTSLLSTLSPADRGDHYSRAGFRLLVWWGVSLCSSVATCVTIGISAWWAPLLFIALNETIGTFLMLRWSRQILQLQIQEIAAREADQLSGTLRATSIAGPPSSPLTLWR